MLKAGSFAVVDGSLRYVLEETEHGKSLVNKLDYMSGSEYTSPETNAMAKEASIGIVSYLVVAYGPAVAEMVVKGMFGSSEKSKSKK